MQLKFFSKVKILKNYFFWKKIIQNQKVPETYFFMKKKLPKQSTGKKIFFEKKFTEKNSFRNNISKLIFFTYIILQKNFTKIFLKNWRTKKNSRNFHFNFQTRIKTYRFCSSPAQTLINFNCYACRHFLVNSSKYNSKFLPHPLQLLTPSSRIPIKKIPLPNRLYYRAIEEGGKLPCESGTSTR